MQGTTEFHDQIADALFPQTDPVFDDVTALDTTVDMLNAQSASVQGLTCNNRLPAGKGYGVASAMRLSWRRPPKVSLRKRMVRRALTSRTFFTVWSFFLPL